MFSPVVWYLNQLASWGLIPAEWQYANIPMLLGGIVAFIGCCGFLYGVIDLYVRFSVKFDDNMPTRLGFGIFAVIGGFLAIALGAVLSFCLATGIVGLLMLEPLVPIVGLLALPLILIVIGKVRSGKLDLPGLRSAFAKIRPLFPQRSTKEDSLSPVQDIDDEYFYTYEVEGVKITRPR